MVHATFELEKAGDAHEALSADVHGKLVLIAWKPSTPGSRTRAGEPAMLDFITVIAAAAVIVFVVGRQFVGEPLRGKRVVLLPAILTVIGLSDLGGKAQPVKPVDIAFLVIAGRARRRRRCGTGIDHAAGIEGRRALGSAAAEGVVVVGALDRHPPARERCC
ncbi:MAG TPA: hypothetical protein VFE40_04125 [Jatrophihabitantaceae bacterium]|nr:hypothetical protein [Jatrophihabitantaceae bacterium]